MNLAERIERSKSKERIKFSEIGCIDLGDKLVKVPQSAKIIVEPCWMIEGDFEGGMYADYIAEHPEYDGVYLRPELLKRIEKVAKSLSSEYRLVIRAGHRPAEVQNRLLRECMQDYKDDNPDVTDEEALEHARTFVSDPAILRPPHCCGSAVDVELYNTKKNQLVDFGSTMNEDNEI